MLKGMKFRIYPNKEQQNLIKRTFGCCRVVYNKELDRCNDLYRAEGRSVSYSDSCKVLTSLKKEAAYAWLSEVDSSALQQSLRDLHRARRNFFEHRAGFPKFKKKSDSRQGYRTQCTNNNICVAGKYIKLPKLGYVRAKISMPVTGKINSATIEKVPSGKYFCVLNVEVEDVFLPNNGCMVGIDVGIREFYSDSNGNTVPNPGYLSKSEKKLRREQRRLSRMMESHITNYKAAGSKRFPVYDKPLSECRNIQKQRIKVARIYERISNQRNDFLQKESTKLVKENQLICIEDLAVKNMVKNHKLAKSISDVSWSGFFDMLEYKSAVYGTAIVKVPRFYANSQTCNSCGYKNTRVKDLSVREWTCPSCGTYNQRDFNAARNILDKGLSMLGTG